MDAHLFKPINHFVPTGLQIAVSIHDNADGFSPRNLDLRTDCRKKLGKSNFVQRTKLGHLLKAVAEMSNDMLIVLPFDQKDVLKRSLSSHAIHPTT